MRKLKIFLALTVIIFSSSCALIRKLSETKPLPQIDYLEKAQKMDFQKFFNGNLDGFSIKQGVDGKIIETQTFKISANWDENKGVIKKTMVSNSGAKDIRTWLVTMNDDGTFEAIGHDVVVAAKGKQIGNAAQSFYSLMLGEKNAKDEFLFEERMYLVGENEMMMITNFEKKKNKNSKPDNNSFGKVISSIRKIADK